MTRHNVGQLDDFKALADTYGATLRITRLRPSVVARRVDELTDGDLYDYDGVLTGDSFFHLSAYGEALPGLNLCGAGRVVCLIDPVGDVYACPFAIHEQFPGRKHPARRGIRVGGATSELFTQLRAPQTGGACAKCGHFDSCRGGCIWAKFFTGLPLDGPDPECVRGYGESALAQQREIQAGRRPPRSLPLTPITRRPKRACDVNPCANCCRELPDMAGAGWFESVAEAQRLEAIAQEERLGALVAGSERGLTVDDIVAAFAELGFAPHVAGLSSKRELSTTVLGQSISLPVFISPTGVQAVHSTWALSRAPPPPVAPRSACPPSPASRSRSPRSTRRPSFRCTGPVAATNSSPGWSACSRRRRRRPDHHHRLVVLQRPRLGQPENPRKDGPVGHAAVRTRRHQPAAVAARFRQDREGPT